MFVIRTPNPNYRGETLGVRFENGKAVVEDEILFNTLVNDYGYLSEQLTKPEEKTVTKTRRTSTPKPSGK